ncbi:MAG: hypothetical protein HYX74_02025 [Acidobacteria bacterium]|nr:hypothetical protein [Acidobacteriota bacterium]
MKERLWLSLLVLALSTARVGAASDVTLFGLWTPAGSLQTGLGNLELKNPAGFGVRHEKYVAIFGLENSIAYYRNPLTVAGEKGDDGLGYAGSLTVNVPVGGTFPFFVMGLGFLHKYGDSFPDVSTRFATHIGFGIKLRKLLGPAGARFDYRRFTLYDVSGRNVKMNELSGGLILSF